MSGKTMILRAETPDDYIRVQALHSASFPGPEESVLVNQLRMDGDAVISRVAIEGDVLVGHVLFSRMSAPFKALGLGPVAVLPDWRRKGIAARLIEEGIELARKDDWDGIFVLGDPDYYQRFGFDVALAKDFQSPYAGPYFMGLALQGGDLPCHTGSVDYASAFSELG